MINWTSRSYKKFLTGLTLALLTSQQALSVLALESSTSSVDKTAATLSTHSTTSATEQSTLQTTTSTSQVEIEKDTTPSTNQIEASSTSTSTHSKTTTTTQTAATETSKSQTISSSSAPILSTSTTSQSSVTSSSSQRQMSTETKSSKIEVPASSTTPSASSTIPGSNIQAPNPERLLIETPVYRLYQPDLQVHLYTKDKKEYQHLSHNGWIGEEQAWRSATQKGQEVYRLYQPDLRVHLYTKDKHEYQVLAHQGWRQEGVAFHSYGSIPVYRLYQPDLKKHLYTRDQNEYTVLSHRNWIQEGIAFYAIEKGETRRSIQPPRGKLTVQKQNEKEGTLEVIISQVSASFPIQSIKVPVWSEKNGQDDLIWYTPSKQADGTYVLKIDAKKHKSTTGTYHIHLYYQLQDQDTWIASTSSQLTLQPIITNFSINRQITPSNEVILTLEGMDERLIELNASIWSEKNGQDDRTHYQAKKISNTSYQISFPLKSHHFQTGLYHVHFSGKANNGLSFTKAATFHVDKLAQQVTNPVFQLQTEKTHEGSLGLTITETETTKQIAAIRIAAWLGKNQRHLHWYTLAPTTSDTTIPIHIGFHNYQSGSYYIHAYIDYKDGTTTFHNLGSVTLSSPYTGSIQAVLSTASKLIGVRGGTPLHAQLITDYNSVTPLPVGYAVKYDDDWCDIFVTVLYQRLNLSHLIGRECGVDRHIQIFKSLGIWNEDGTITPQPGDIITFNWDQNQQPNDGFADHIGIVERVENGRIYTIEGNSLNEVRRQSYPIGDGHIRGFARPRY